MIELVNLTKYYPTPLGRHYVFKNLNFVFPEGANIGLMGRNGAGKSTLMRVMGGLDRPDEGFVRTQKSISWPVGLSSAIQSSLTARDNVRFVCRLYGASPQEVKERMQFVEDFAELGKFFDLPMKTYSSGMRGRVAFGLSLAFDFDYYLVDEGMATGDPIFRKKAQALFRQKISKSNLILVSHNTKDILDLCNTVVVLEGGVATLYEDVAEGLSIYENMQKKSSPRRLKASGRDL
ncbi:ABC transporter ATP-binding protein [Vitreoscilla filiformis]|jgi:capsular polysaccharide transport system ATP-binding protein|uniref:ABC transporter ATP-binding protein n=1 Tax=Vitreoscilla filiformis TaxID=63 RepID=A0A221KD73_VITFI|nr:ABC transporter ATP-binding protein [Vitreoscilla filiformis]ASM76909.1 ABC transporter ATP-binding protein [Vitreoscilla filiformis]